jgi:HEPN domain-containing protein
MRRRPGSSRIRDLGRAERSYADAEASAAAGRFDKAVLEYEQSWTNAIKALR